MKTLAWIIFAGLGLTLAGCVAVPVGEPVYVGPPTVVVQPYGYYGYRHNYYGPRHSYYRGG